MHDFTDRDLGKAIPYGAYEVAADLHTTNYPAGIKITDRQTHDLEHTALRRHFHGDWDPEISVLSIDRP